MLEHYISEDLEALIAAKLGEPSHDPHGTPIPGPDLLPPAGRREPAGGEAVTPPRGAARRAERGRPPGRGARSPPRRAARWTAGTRLRPLLALPRPGLRRRRRLRRPRQLRHQHRRRRQVRLPAALGGAGRQPDRDAGPDPVGEAGDRHRQEPRRALPRALLAPHLGRALAAGRGGGDGDSTSPRWSAPPSASTCSSASRCSRPGVIAGAGAFGILALQQMGFRRLEAGITALVGVVVASFVFELFDAKPEAAKSPATSSSPASPAPRASCSRPGSSARR